jgi:hypothetical protein
MSELVARLPTDPLWLALLALAVWVPLCAIALGLLSLISFAQQYVERGRRRGPALVVPPQALRPLAGPRYVSVGPRSGGLLSATRVLAAVALVLLFTAYVLMTYSPTLLAALRLG